ncbi:MAG: LysR family transcriptional regulator [bacterium]|nr:LysR family transcriptional regulator [bacterium]
MNINFELYRVFYVVANCNSITEASKKLSISQPAVTKTIKNLENQLNGNLFFRSKKGISLTEEGKNFYNYIRPAVEQIYEAENQFSNITKLDIGEIKIGTSNTILKYFLMDYLKKYSLSFPNINISIEESYTPNLINMVKNGAIDIAIIYAGDDDKKLEGLKVYNFKKLHYCLIGNEKYKKYSTHKIEFKDIENEKLILNTINPIQTNFVFSDKNQYRAYINLASHSLVYEFVKEGFGIGIAIKEFIQDNLEKKELYEIKLKDEFQPVNLIMITNKNNFPNYATSELIHLIENQK